jgi:hypothetical protein
MHFVFYPNHEFACPHLAHCPHLGGAALSLLVSAADEQTEWTNALHRQIEDLRASDTAKRQTIEQLTARIEQLERELKAERQRQFQATKEEPRPAATPPEGRKKRGAPMGHPGWFRQRPTSFDQLIAVAVPQCCPHCGCAVRARPDHCLGPPGIGVASWLS